MPELWIHELIDALDRRKPRERKAVIDGYANMTGLSRAQIYRIAKKHGWKSGRKPRIRRQDEK